MTESVNVVSEEQQQPEAAGAGPDSLEARAALGAEIASNLCQMMGLPIDAVQGSVDGDAIVVRIDGDLGDAENLDGRAWESMQFLLNKAVHRSGGRRCRLHLRVEGFRSRRRDPLDAVAMALADKAAKLQRVITLGPLDDEDLKAWSGSLQRHRGTNLGQTGSDEARRLVIAPEGHEADGGGRNRRRRRRKRRN
ncbi:MAG: hypothetical protein H6747_05840 [Deltaproteobacteria bacterium]|nr:hypothetical protein [Deltaproteobacteria bacterium]